MYCEFTVAEGSWFARKDSSFGVIAELQQIFPTLSVVDFANMILYLFAVAFASFDRQSELSKSCNGPAMFTFRRV